MISLHIKDTKQFMSHLLIKDTWDNFLLSEATLMMANPFTISGEINRSFFTNEEYEALSDKTYMLWSQIKPFCYSIIKGNKVPTAMKIIFVLPKNIETEILTNADSTIAADDIDRLFVNVRYNENGITLITGTCLHTFTLDKTLEHGFDHYIKNFLNQAENMCGDNHCLPLLFQIQQEICHYLGSQYVKPVCRLIKNNNIRPVYK